MHNINANLGLSHYYYPVARKTPWLLVGVYAMETKFLLYQLISSG